MKHEDMMQKAWQFIKDCGITENKKEHEQNDQMYLVKNIYKVRDAYCQDLENSYSFEDEDLPGFLNRHGIEWK